MFSIQNSESLRMRVVAVRAIFIGIVPLRIWLLPGSNMLQRVNPLLGNSHKQSRLHSNE
jgi:hypothetical protein